MQLQILFVTLLLLVILPLVAYEQDSTASKLWISRPFALGGFDTLDKVKFADSTLFFQKANRVLANQSLMPARYLSAEGNFPKARKAHFFSLSCGTISYDFLYRSYVDTPFLEKNIAQHQSLASFGFNLFHSIPFQANAFLRRSNSKMFRDIADIQVQFDASSYKSRLQNGFQEGLHRYAQTLKDTVTENYYFAASKDLAQMSRWLNAPEILQKLVEANEVIGIEEITYDKDLSDSLNRLNSDSLRERARSFLNYYNEMTLKKVQLNRKVDSLKQLNDSSLAKFRSFQQMLQQSFNGGYSYRQLRSRAAQLGFDGDQHFGPGTWLLGLRNLGIGRNNINASELTVKNVSVNGINVEYNSWYYFQAAGGAVNYHYRDFVNYNFNKPRQYLYLLRIGLGDTYRNALILSAYHGQKQFFGTALPASNAKITISGLSMEARWQMMDNTYVISEVAQSFSPGQQVQPSTGNKNRGLYETSHKAMSVKLYSYIPNTSSHLEFRYKFIGADFQSFNSFQTNSQNRSWAIKGEQNFFHRRVRVSGDLSTSEFSNPFIRLNYRSSTVFKTINLRVNFKKWPVINVGYLPTSQLTMVDGYLSESKFQTINASMSHIYKIGQAGGNTNLVFTKFFNNKADSGFIYFNSANVFAGQTLLFKNFTINLNISCSNNYDYTYTVVDENIGFMLGDRKSLGISVKLNKLNGEMLRLGGGINCNLRIFKNDVLSFQLDKSYLPSKNSLLVPGVFGSLNYTKTLK